MAAATASSLARSRRPPSPPFASFALPLGSLISPRASAMLDRSSKLLTGVTLPSSAARRKA